MKNIENFIIKETKPLSTTSWNNIIKEDHKNINIKIYDESIFKKAKCFKVVLDNDEENKIEEEMNKKEEEEKKKKFEEFLEKISLATSYIEKSINEIKRDMEEDQKKRDELERQEKIRIEQERKRREEQEKKRKEELERKKREEIERKRREDLERRKKEEEEKRRKEQEKIGRGSLIINPIQNAGESIKERLINAGNNFQNIINEVKKINENRSLKTISDKILKNINETNTKLSLASDINESSKKFIKLLDELKGGQYQDLYLYACFQILATLSEKLYDLSISSQSYEKYFIVSKIISKINSKTLTYMLYQRISYICPYIIPVIYSKRDFPDKDILKKRQGFLNDDRNIKDVYNRMTNYEYLYFIFLWLDANRNINIIEDYIKNIETFRPAEINYLISNSFLCFIDVFGNYIYENKNNWFQRIINIYKNVIEGLELSNKNTNNSAEKNINSVISYKIKDCITRINKKRQTKFKENIVKFI
mgnify:CR=1 FL=1